jgi:hypothetical protein
MNKKNVGKHFENNINPPAIVCDRHHDNHRVQEVARIRLKNLRNTD